MILNLGDYIQSQLYKYGLKTSHTIVALLVFLYTTFFSISVFFYSKLLSTELWTQDKMMLISAIYISGNYIFHNLGQILTNICSVLSQAKMFLKIDRVRAERAHIERDIRACGEIHNIFGNLFSIVASTFVSFYGLYKLGPSVLLVYTVALIFMVAFLKAVQLQIRRIDGLKKEFRDLAVKKIGEIEGAIECREIVLRHSWSSKRWAILSRFIMNLIPIVALIITILLSDLSYFSLSSVELLSLIIITSGLVDISDNLSNISTYVAKVKVSLLRIASVSQATSPPKPETGSIGRFTDYASPVIEGVSNMRNTAAQYIYILSLGGRVRYKFIFACSVLIMLVYAAFRYFFDLMAARQSGLYLLSLIVTASVVMLVFADYLFKRTFHRVSIELGNGLIQSMHRNGGVKADRLEVYSHDMAIVDDGVSFSLTEGLYALSTVFIASIVFILNGGNILALIALFSFFYVIQKQYRHKAIITKRLDVELSSKAATCFFNESNENHGVFLASLTAQLLNTFNNRIFMIVVGLFIALCISLISLTGITDGLSHAQLVAMLVLFIKLSSALSYAIRYISQLEGWAVSIGRIKRIICSSSDLI